MVNYKQGRFGGYVPPTSVVAIKYQDVVEFSGAKTLALSDRNTLQIYTGTGAAALTIPPDATAEFAPGTTIRVMRGASAGALTFAAPGVTVTASDGFVGNSFYPGEILEVQKIGAEAWLGHTINDRQIGIRPYTFLEKSAWVASGLVAASSIPVTTTVQAGTVSVGLQTENSGGVFAITGAAGSTETTKEPHGFYANAVHLRRSINDATVPAFPISVDDGGVDRLVFGLLHTTAADGDAINGSNLNLSFVYESTGGTLVSTTISGDIEFELLFAVANDDVPFEPA